MKNPLLLPFAAIAAFAITGCNKSNQDVAKKLAELENQNHSPLPLYIAEQIKTKSNQAIQGHFKHDATHQC